MRIAIMQPTYLPWMGYFNLISQTDIFVFLDNTPFSHRSWQQRNRIVDGNRRLAWLTVPVLVSGRAGQTIKEVEVNDDFPWRRKHLAAINAAYARAPYGSSVSEIVAGVLNGAETRLCEINIALITSIARCLELTTPLVRASALGCEGKRSEHLLAICRKLGGECYVSPAGAQDYIEVDGVFAAANLPVIFQRFTPPVYKNVERLSTGEFPSILDALAWLGPDVTRALLDKEIA